VLGFVFAKPMLEYITRPVNDAISNFYEERRKTVGEGTDDPNHTLNAEKPGLKLKIPAKDVVDWVKKVLPDAKVPETTDQTPALEVTAYLQNQALLAYNQVPIQERMGHRNVLTALSATEAFVVWMMISLVLGIIIASPMILYELWSFVAAGLYPHEKRYVYYLLPMSIGLFFAGVLMYLVIWTAHGLIYRWPATRLDEKALEDWIGHKGEWLSGLAGRLAGRWKKAS